MERKTRKELALDLSAVAPSHNPLPRDWEAAFRNPETKSESQHVDAVTKKKDLEVPRRQLWTELGYSQQQVLDWEAELAIVIGRPAKHVSKENALDYVAGYSMGLDMTIRGPELQSFRKSVDTYAVCGPWMVTKDEIADPQNLKCWLKVNGVTRQNSSTNQMIFGVRTLVSYLSQFMTLLPGDVISTGTPPGVGLGFKPPIFMKAGDVVELGIEGLGESKQNAVAWSK